MKIKKTQIVRLCSQVFILVAWGFGVYSTLSPVILALLIGGLVFGNTFCGWVCPFGSAQELMGRIGSIFIKKKLKTPRWLQIYLQFSRYIIFAVILLGVAPAIIYHINGYTSFLFLIHDIMDSMVTISLATVAMTSYLIIGLFFDRPFCNYLCSEGAKFGLAGLPRIFSIKRDEDICINCKLCDKACPMNISISDRSHVRSAQCINCLKCVSSCPKSGALGYKYIGWKRNTK